MAVLFQMSDFEREENIAAHDFYFDQANLRIINQFSDINGDADNFLNSLSKSPPTGFSDHASFTDWALGEAINYYEMVSQMRDDIRLGLIAGMYHRWDKAFRHWVFHNLQFFFRGEEVKKVIWLKSFSELATIFVPFNWDVVSSEYSLVLEKLYLTVNVHKHGEGSSWKRLKTKFPELVRDPLEYPSKPLNKIEVGSPYFLHLGYQNLYITHEHFSEFHDAIKKFWLDVPDKIEFQVTDNIPFPEWLETAIEKQREIHK